MAIRLYQYSISPFLGHHCRFWPTCSDYALLALQRYSLPMAILYLTKRIIKCHPFHEGGEDLPPLAPRKKRSPHGHNAL